MTTAVAKRQERRYVWLKEDQVYGGKKIGRGQIVVLGNYPNDSKLLELGYLQLLPQSATPVQCMRCAGEFVDETTLAVHQSTCPEVDMEIDGLKTDGEQQGKED